MTVEVGHALRTAWIRAFRSDIEFSLGIWGKEQKMNKRIRKWLAVALSVCLLTGGMQTLTTANAAKGNNAAGGSAGAGNTDTTQLPEMDNFKHLKRGKTSVTIGWDDVDDASLYYLRWLIYDANAQEILEEVATDTTFDAKYTISGIPQGGFAVLGVTAYDAGMKELAEGTYVGVPVIPKVKKVDHFWAKEKLNVVVTPQIAVDDYTLTCYSASGKKIQTVKSSMRKDGTVVAKFSKTNRKNCYKIKITPRFRLSEDLSTAVDFKGKARTVTCVPQPIVTTAKKDVKRNSITIRWKKVKKAKKYTIYVATSSELEKDETNLNFKKVKTLSAKKTKYTLKKFRGKKVNTRNKYYYFKIVTTAKVGKKTVKSGDLEYYYAYTWLLQNQNPTAVS